MAERPRYIATTSRTVSGQPSANPRSGPMTPTNPPTGESGELDRIRDKARRAKEFYNSIGLSNGDLLTHQQAQKEARRRSASPDKHNPRSSGSGSGAYGWKDPGSNAYSKYGQTWVKPRSRPASKDLDADLYQHPHHKTYTLPSKSHQHASAAIDIRSTRSGSAGGSVKSRSKSASCEINEVTLKVGSNDESHFRGEKTRPPPVAAIASSLDDDDHTRSASLTRTGRLPYQADHPRALNGLPRIDSHLHRSNTSLNSDSGADGVSSEARDKSAMPPPSVETVTLFRGKLDRQRSSSDARSEKRSSRSSDYLSASFDAADHARPKMAPAARAFGSASTLDQALGDEDDEERQNISLAAAADRRDALSHNLPPSTKHLKKNKSDSRGSSPINSANASPRLPRKHKDKGSRSKSDVPDHKTLISRIARDNARDNARDVVDAMRQEMSLEEERRRRHHFAHYDWQSMLFSFRDVLTAMEGLKRKNTTTGASKAAALAASTDSLGSKGSSVSGSMEDMSNFIEEDEGLGSNKFNDLVSNCPFFRNEIGGEPERVVCIAASGNNASSVSIQVGNGANSQEKTTIQARKVLTNHSFLSVVEGGNQETLLPPGSPPTGSVSFGIENRDEGACYYRQYFFDKEHQNFFGIDDKYGPVVISLRREKIEDSAGVAAYQYRVIVRTSELCTLRGSILEEAIHQSSSKHASTTKGIPPKEVLEYLCPEINLSCLRVAVATPKVHEQLVKVDEQNVYKTYKIGVLYCRAKQSTEEDMYNNEHASPAFSEFLQLLGSKVKLNGFSEFRGGLDVKTDSTGTESVFTQFRDYKIMFHVSTMLPYTPNNRQQLLRKRHIGNDIMTIVFQEPGSEPFNPKNIRSHFQHVFLVVRAHQPCTTQTCYRVSVTRSRSIPRFGPPMPANCMFPKSPSFREFLLTKIINGENMVHKAGKFKAMAMNTRQEYLRDLYLNHSSQAGLEGKPNFGRFPFASASRRIREGGREKQRSRPTPELLSRGALSWHVNVKDYNSPEVVPCLLGMSDCVLNLVEIASRQLIFSIPCQAVLGWTVPPPVADPAERGCYKRDLHVYYGRGERLSVQTDDIYSREEIIVRLERFTKGSETIYRQLHRNNRGELGFNVNYEGILSDGKAFQDGLRQSSRLVEICKVAVATMTHDEVLDLLRTSKVVKVVAIPPHDDGTPRKCSMELYHLAPILDVKPVPEGMTFQSFHDRTRSEPVQRSSSHPIYADAVDDLGVGHQRSESYNTSHTTPKHQVHHDVSHTAGDLLLRDTPGGGKTRKSGKKSAKHGSRQNKELEENGSRVVLFTAATRLAATVADSNGHSSASNTLSSTKSTFSNLSSQSGADIDFADVEDKRPSSNGAALQCSSSLSTDSGLNSNNNSSSTLSRVSTDTPTMSNQTLSYDEPWEDSYHQHSYSFNQNSNNSISYGSMPRKNSSPATSGAAPAGETPIIRVNWNPKPTNLSLGSSLPQEKGKPHSPFAVDCTPSSEVNRSLRVYIAGTEAHKNARYGQGQISAPSTPSTHERLQMHPPIHHSQSVGPTLHNTPTKWRNPHQPSRRTVVPQLAPSNTHNHVTPNTASPRTKRKSVTPHHASRVKSSTSKSVSNPHKTSTGGAPAHGTDIQNTLIRLLAESPSKHSPAKRPSPHRKSPGRLGSQRTSPKRRTSSSDFSSDHLPNSHRASPTRLRVIQRTVSDESLCGARPDNLLLKRQESRQMKDAPRTLYSHHVSGSVDSLAPPPPPDRGRRRPHAAGTQPANGNSPMLPLPDATSWDRILDAAKAAEVFEASSVRSVSMGTLNDIGAEGDPRHSSSINRNGVGYPAQRTMSVENLYDHEFRGNQGDPTNLLRKREPPTPTARPLFDLGEPPLDYAQSVMMSQSGMTAPGGQPSQSEQRLERIEMELRLLQDKLKKEQESKLELEKEVHLLRRDNTLLQRHATPNDARHAHKRPKRKQQKS